MMTTISVNPDTPYTIYIVILSDDDILLGANGRDIDIIMIPHINNILIRYEVCFRTYQSFILALKYMYFGCNVIYITTKN